MPGPSGRPRPGVEAAEYQPCAMLRWLDGGKDQPFALEPDFDRRQVQRRSLAKPLGGDRPKGVFPELRQRGSLLQLGLGYRHEHELYPVLAQALRLRRGHGPAGVARAGWQVSPRELAYRAEERHQEVTLALQLVLEKTGSQQRQPPVP